MTLPALTRSLVPLRALVLYALFLGAAWAALRLTGGTRLGVLVGPLAAQAAMAAVVFVASRTLLRSEPAPARLVAQRRLRPTPLVFVALGGFLFQISLLTGLRFLSAAGAEVSAVADVHVAWVVLAVSSVLGAPVLEEVFFRGMLQPVLSRRHVGVGLVVTAALFGVAHGFQVPLRALPTFLQGLVLGGLVLVTGRLRAAVLVHALNNALVLAVSLLLLLRPGGLSLTAGGSGWSAAVCAAAALTLLGMGFVGLLREPHLAAAVEESPAAA